VIALTWHRSYLTDRTAPSAFQQFFGATVGLERVVNAGRTVQLRFTASSDVAEQMIIKSVTIAGQPATTTGLTSTSSSLYVFIYDYVIPPLMDSPMPDGVYGYNITIRDAAGNTQSVQNTLANAITIGNSL